MVWVPKHHNLLKEFWGLYQVKRESNGQKFIKLFQDSSGEDNLAWMRKSTICISSKDSFSGAGPHESLSCTPSLQTWVNLSSWLLLALKRKQIESFLECIGVLSTWSFEIRKDKEIERMWCTSIKENVDRKIIFGTLPHGWHRNYITKLAGV